MKKVLSLFLAAVFMFLFIPETINPMVFEAAESSVSQLVDGVYYKIDGDHAVVTGCDAVASVITVRAKYKDYPVTEIADSAFKNAVLEKVTLSDGVTKIGVSAFENCTKLASIEIPETVTLLGNKVFGGCLAIKSIIVPAGVKTMGRYVFSGWTEDQIIYFANLTEAPSGWHSEWFDSSDATVVWNYQPETF